MRLLNTAPCSHIPTRRYVFHTNFDECSSTLTIYWSSENGQVLSGGAEPHWVCKIVIRRTMSRTLKANMWGGTEKLILQIGIFRDVCKMHFSKDSLIHPSMFFVFFFLPVYSYPIVCITTVSSNFYVKTECCKFFVLYKFSPRIVWPYMVIYYVFQVSLETVRHSLSNLSRV